MSRQPRDPIPHLAALIDGLHRAALQNNRDGTLLILADLLTGPYAALRGGLLLDEPGWENMSTKDAIREALNAKARQDHDQEDTT